MSHSSESDGSGEQISSHSSESDVVGAIVPPETVALVAEATEEMSRAEMAVTLLYALESDEITLLTLLTNALVSVTPWLAAVASTPDASEMTELYWTFIEARRESAANAATEHPVL